MAAALTNIQRRALRYVANGKGRGTLADFTTDHDPIGERLWEALREAGLVIEVHGLIKVTDKGEKELK